MTTTPEIKPVMRDEAKERVRFLFQNISHQMTKEMNDIVQRYPTHQSCLTCKNFDEKTELCAKYNARPPARVIAYSCPSYDDVDEIPF